MLSRVPYFYLSRFFHCSYYCFAVYHLGWAAATVSYALPQPLDDRRLVFAIWNSYGAYVFYILTTMPVSLDFVNHSYEVWRWFGHLDKPFRPTAKLEYALVLVALLLLRLLLGAWSEQSTSDDDLLPGHETFQMVAAGGLAIGVAQQVTITVIHSVAAAVSS